MTYDVGRRPARRLSEFLGAPGQDAAFPLEQTKLGARRVAAAVGIKVPDLLATFASAHDIDLSAAPDRFVLKSNLLSSKRGVFLLERRGSMFFELFRQRLFDDKTLAADLTRTLRRHGRPLDTPVILEELVVGENGAGEIPYDYKLYTFDGEVAFVDQANRNIKPTGVGFFGRNFEPLPQHHIAHLKPGPVQQIAPVRPSNWQDLLEVARRISLYLDRPFIRVDTYTTGDAVVLGELTPRPGGPYHGDWRFSDAFDDELGQLFAHGYLRRGLAIPTVTGLPPVLARHDARLHPLRLDKLARAYGPAVRRRIMSGLRSLRVVR